MLKVILNRTYCFNFLKINTIFQITWSFFTHLSIWAQQQWADMWNWRHAGFKTKHTDYLVFMLNSREIQMPRSDTLLHTITFAESFNRCFRETLFPSCTLPCEAICGLFVCGCVCRCVGVCMCLYLFDFSPGFHGKVAHRRREVMFFFFFVLWYCMSWTMCAPKININLCADFVPSRALCVCLCVCVFWCTVCFCFWIRPRSSPIISQCLCMCWFISTVPFRPSTGCLLFVSSCVNAEAFDHLWQCEYFSSF